MWWVWRIGTLYPRPLGPILSDATHMVVRPKLCYLLLNWIRLTQAVLLLMLGNPSHPQKGAGRLIKSWCILLTCYFAVAPLTRTRRWQIGVPGRSSIRQTDHMQTKCQPVNADRLTETHCDGTIINCMFTRKNTLIPTTTTASDLNVESLPTHTNKRLRWVCACDHPRPKHLDTKDLHYLSAFFPGRDVKVLNHKP